jgi:hypothetical protein
VCSEVAQLLSRVLRVASNNFECAGTDDLPVYVVRIRVARGRYLGLLRRIQHASREAADRATEPDESTGACRRERENGGKLCNKGGTGLAAIADSPVAC